MTSGLRNAWDALWGRGEHSVTVPSMDGALRPNTALDEAQTILTADNIDNLATFNGALYFTTGRKLQVLDGVGAEPRTVSEFASDITALAIARSGRAVIGLDEGKLLVGASPSEVRPGSDLSFGGRNAYVTALAFGPKDDLFICIGSSINKASQWKRALMSRDFSGSVWQVPKDSISPKMLGDKLAFPSGVGFFADGTPVVAEAWKHRLIRRTPEGNWQPVLIDLPGYPGRLASAPGEDGSLWLCVFAPRSQLIEFVLREKLYRQRMIERVDEQFWVAPTLRGGKSFKEPLQGGGVKHLGIRKPWGPTRSYGLIVKLDPAGLPIVSQHSRSDGDRHGITSAVAWNGGMLAASKGNGALISLIDLDWMDGA